MPTAQAYITLEALAVQSGQGAGHLASVEPAIYSWSSASASAEMVETQFMQFCKELSEPDRFPGRAERREHPGGRYLHSTWQSWLQSLKSRSGSRQEFDLLLELDASEKDHSTCNSSELLLHAFFCGSSASQQFSGPLQKSLGWSPRSMQ